MQCSARGMKITIVGLFPACPPISADSDDYVELTFIILARSNMDENVTPDTIGALQMVGDVNLFFKGSKEDDDFEVEAEVMVAGVCCGQMRYLNG
jgi:hypothetical protein